MKKLYLFNFNDSLGTREKITAHLDTNPKYIHNWYYCMTNTIFIISSYTAQQLFDFIQKIDNQKTSRFIVSEMDSSYDYQGWLPKDAWDFINKNINP